MKTNLKNRPQLQKMPNGTHVYNITTMEKWFEAFEKEERDKEEWRTKQREQIREKHPNVGTDALDEFAVSFYYYLKGRSDEAKEVLGDES